MPYQSPQKDVRFILNNVVGFSKVTAHERFADVTEDVVAAILTEAGKLSDEVLAPLQRVGDLNPAHLDNGVVRTPPGFDAGWRAIAEGGWIATSSDPKWGGMGLPQSLTTAVNDFMGGACLSAQLAPLMAQGQIEAIEHHAADWIKDLYLPKLNAGDWSATMNLTEPQAGSDVGALTTRAEPLGDGSYALSGQKIFISAGDNDYTENVVHLVLARLPDAPPGTKGISLFIVPKFIPDDAGTPGARNDVRVVSVEHKMGLHGSATCVMEYAGARGWLVGAEGGGMAAMFTMMNNARLGVGVQGLCVGEAAYQQALEYALSRKQGRVADKGGNSMIIDHADVRRMLGEMRALTFAARAMALDCAVAIDMGHATGEAHWQARAALLTPIVKAFGTETGMRVSETAVQVHGGMGYIEETGAAQFSRDVRVTAIYEGTNGIQAMDLVGRKLADGGAAAETLLAELMDDAVAAKTSLPDEAAALTAAVDTLRETTRWMVEQDFDARAAGAFPYLMGFAHVLGGAYHLRAAMAGGANSTETRLARLYYARILPRHASMLTEARAGDDNLFALTPEDLQSA